MRKAEIERKVREALAGALELPLEEIPLEARLEADLGAESIDLIDIAFRIEKTFGIETTNEQLYPHSQVTVGELAGIVAARLGCGA
jgi:acyl carrier protein